MMFRSARITAVGLALALSASVLAGCKWDHVSRRPPQPAPISTIAFHVQGDPEPFLFNTSVKYAQLAATAGQGWEVFLVLNPMGADKFHQEMTAHPGQAYEIVLNNRVIGSDILDGRYPRGYARVKGNMSLAEANELLNILGAAGIATERKG